MKLTQPAPSEAQKALAVDAGATIATGVSEHRWSGHATRRMRFCFDLDNTLVTYPRVHRDYSSVQPMVHNIQLVRELHAAGHYIIIQTARRMKTHNGNVGAVIADTGLVTLQTLARFAIPYDELLFGKPYADVYVDDLAVHSLIDTAKEIGWVLDSTPADRAESVPPIAGFMHARHFNTLQELDNTVFESAASCWLGRCTSTSTHPTTSRISSRGYNAWSTTPYTPRQRRPSQARGCRA